MYSLVDLSPDWTFHEGCVLAVGFDSVRIDGDLVNSSTSMHYCSVKNFLYFCRSAQLVIIPALFPYKSQKHTTHLVRCSGCVNGTVMQLLGARLNGQWAFRKHLYCVCNIFRPLDQQQALHCTNCPSWRYITRLCFRVTVSFFTRGTFRKRWAAFS